MAEPAAGVRWIFPPRSGARPGGLGDWLGWHVYSGAAVTAGDLAAGLGLWIGDPRAVRPVAERLAHIVTTGLRARKAPDLGLKARGAPVEDLQLWLHRARAAAGGSGHRGQVTVRSSSHGELRLPDLDLPDLPVPSRAAQAAALRVARDTGQRPP